MKMRWNHPIVALSLALGIAGVATAAITLRSRPTQLGVPSGAKDDTVVINKTHPTQLTVSVLDQYRRRLHSDTAVRFRRIGGGSIDVSPSGVVACARNEDAVVQATFMRLVREFSIHCRPVVFVEAVSWMNFVVGDTARDLSFTAHGPDGSPVTELRGNISLGDGSIAEVIGTRVRPKRAGQTMAVVEIGDQSARVSILVYRSVTSFVDNPPSERLLAMHVRLVRGDTIEVPLPKAAFWVKYLPTDRKAAPPTIELSRNGACSTGDGMRVKRVEEGEYVKYCLTQAGAMMMIAHGATGAEVVEGNVTLQLVW
ncbi:MAG: hypothetical protein ABI442_03525 [Gemmatimonadaceae bacterium]